MSQEIIKTRFAPSPTGYLHIGGLRNALYNYIFARQNNGKYILRIEDTDQKREVAGASEKLIATLQRIGLPYAEGPILENGKIVDKGDFGPYIQSKRINLYQKYALELAKEKKAYYCFCASERLDKMREEQQARKIAPKYDRHCLNLTEQEIQDKIAKGEKYVIRFKIPDDGEFICNDIVKGEVKFKTSELDDFVILKSDGFTTYHLAHIVDDRFMKITHVLRGDEWLPSLPKHILLWQAFGWESPIYAHLPLLLNSDKSKLSKRQGDVAVEDYLDKGYLPEAILNFVALLGWNPGEGSEQEIFSMDELIEKFDINKVNKSGAVFNIEKLDWMNGVYIRNMNLDELAKKCLPYFEKWFEENNLFQPHSTPLAPLVRACPELAEGGASANSPLTRGARGVASESPRGDSNGASLDYICSAGVSRQGTPASTDLNYIKKIVSIEQTRLKKLSDITQNIKFFYFDDLKYDPKKIVWKKSNPQDTKKNLQLSLELINDISDKDFTKENLETKLKELIEKEKIGVGDILWPLRYALTAEEKSPNPFEVAWVLGKERSVERVEKAMLIL